MSFFDDLSNFGSGMLDSVGEGFGNLVTHATTPTQTVNPNTQKQVSQEADNYGNAKTTPQQKTGPDNTLLYVGGGLVVLTLVGGLLVLAKSR
ncbi:LPXTG cell wall anchor domain-containing protein [Vibrio coralliilyticus]|uniref:LPXTG cell wall anchor domain-containing protein n=1 Tax=Vibrio coralliilyticus TaxID=190893 RepID=A0AAP7DEX5_9VIBR|nr:LPXTG cell wall anchor domain-containing protein [Vibrio coralliilyticus]NOJ25464.1 LPXTG cell wall anchor domain-containing protein [Vibrio coralliilyticus]